MTVSLYIPGVSSTPKDQPGRQQGAYPLDMWYVAAHSKELADTPVGRTLLNEPVVLFRLGNGEVAAVEDRCCHRHLPLSAGTVEATGIRCGYHGLLFDENGQCTEIPGQEKIPRKAKVGAYHVRERNQLVWIWFGTERDSEPTCEPPEYKVHDDPSFVFDGDVYHYNAPYQLIHDNLLDLSHLGYVHLRTIGGNASIHMNAKLTVESDDTSVLVVRHMPNSEPPPTYKAAYPFKDRIDRWQEVRFLPSHQEIWTGAIDHGTDDITNPNRGGFHMRGFHGLTPETSTSCHYFWTMATNPTQNIEEIKKKVVDQTAMTFDEDKVVIEAQYENMKRFAGEPMIDIHVDVGPNRARRIIEQLKQENLPVT
ncbi:aromatic ring-hydroxylating dioxygenase subunit alpha [Oceanobacter mangrovi]|uniref:aromatic ring-hydroxylating dioxygenase subunit alpha n=1 Tax=Oceanobacter mangrovi TaxID=2862510 RepID=UPI001C8DF104|nr:aromatic ring-hydroxylating dioxygenase subunit alpha [Oceanobacter mangrovi]